jgi:hypothetical protein
MPRTIAVALLSLLAVGAVRAQIPVQYRPGYEQYREGLQDLLTDELVAPVELPKKLDTCTIPAQADWPKAVGLSLAGDRGARQGYGVVDQATRKLVGAHPGRRGGPPASPSRHTYGGCGETPVGSAGVGGGRSKEERAGLPEPHGGGIVRAAGAARLATGRW